MKPWYADGLRFTCTQCGDCCRSHGDYQWVFLSPTDVTRLAESLGLSNARFLAAYCDKDEDGLGHTLKWLKGGAGDPDIAACVFLGEKGCTVYDARPQQCRTWPFWPENLTKKVWKADVEAYCPGAGEGRLYTLGEIRKISKDEAET